MLTNGLGDWQRAKLAAHDLEQRFDAVVVSCEVGARRPAAAPFHELEGRLGAEEYAMVGDSDSAIEGATGVGWTARRYRGGGFADLPDALDW